ncbi:MAG: hypothetical protein AAF193_07430 [Bacteroidota bacterium]
MFLTSNSEGGNWNITCIVALNATLNEEWVSDKDGTIAIAKGKKT